MRRGQFHPGSAFATIGGASIDKLQVTAGNKSLLIEGECSDGYGARCGRCHAFLFAAVRGLFTSSDDEAEEDTSPRQKAGEMERING